MRTTGAFEPGGSETVAAEVTEALRAWGLPGGAARLWVRSAAERVGPRAAQWVLEHDPQLALVSFEVFAGERRLFGIDDWLG